MSGYGDPYKKQKKVAMLVVSVIFLVSVVAAMTVGIAVGSKDTTKIETPHTGNKNARKAIVAVCAPTEDKEKCVHRLEYHAGNVTDPKELIKVVFKLTMKQVRKVMNTTITLKEIEKDHRTNNTLQGCKELMKKSIHELKRTYKNLSDWNIKSDERLLGNLKTWLSATITYQETCFDGFEGKNATSIGDKMREALENSLELSKDAIAMVTKIEDVLNALRLVGKGEHEVPDANHHRRLLFEGEWYPSWLEHTENQRRFLEDFDLDKLKPTFIVAKDGSGRFTTINDALIHVPRNSDKPTVIYVKEGVYNEIVHISPNMHHLFMIGDGADKTRITGRLNYVDGDPIWKTATFAVSAEYFTAKNIGFENSAGPTKRQAVALRVDADMSVFYNCSMEGYQGTLYAHAKRQFYRDCSISGTIDFVFGDGSAIFQNSKFIIRKPLENQNCIVTAQSRNYTYQPSAIVIQNSTITADHGFLSVKDSHKAYLGRPAREYSRTIIMESYLDAIVDPQGWLPSNGEKGINTCFFAEFDNHGPGADKTQRVKWNGVKNISREEAHHFTAEKTFEDDKWITKLAVPYNPGFFTNGTDEHSN